MTLAEVELNRKIAYCLSYCLLGHLDENIKGISYEFDSVLKRVDVLIHVNDTSTNYETFVDDLMHELVHEEKICDKVAVTFEPHQEHNNKFLKSWFLQKKDFGSCPLNPLHRATAFPAI